MLLEARACHFKISSVLGIAAERFPEGDKEGWHLGYTRKAGLRSEPAQSARRAAGEAEHKGPVGEEG